MADAPCVAPYSLPEYWLEFLSFASLEEAFHSGDAEMRVGRHKIRNCGAGGFRRYRMPRCRQLRALTAATIALLNTIWPGAAPMQAPCREVDF